MDLVPSPLYSVVRNRENDRIEAEEGGRPKPFRTLWAKENYLNFILKDSIHKRIFLEAVGSRMPGRGATVLRSYSRRPDERRLLLD
jgi:hypothetical protein